MKLTSYQSSRNYDPTINLESKDLAEYVKLITGHKSLSCLHSLIHAHLPSLPGFEGLGEGSLGELFDSNKPQFHLRHKVVTSVRCSAKNV